MAGNHGIYQDSVEVKGAPAPYIAAGSGGEPIVMVHGGAGDRRDWVRNIPALADLHKIYAPDLVGYGQAPRLDGRYTLRHFSDYIFDFIEALGLSRVTLVGHSLGARACLEIARQAPDRVAKLVLVAPIGFGRLSPLGYALGASAWALTKAIRRPLPYPDLDVELNEHGLDGFGQAHPPTLILWGRWDLFFPRKYGGRAVKAIPNSRLRVFNRSGHSPHKAQPSAFNEAVLRFLETPDGHV